MRQLLAALVATAVSLVLAPAAAAQASAEIPVLTGNTVLEGDRPAIFAVSIAQDSHIDVTLGDTGLPNALEAEGGEGYVGFILQRAGGVGPTIAGLRAPAGAGARGVGWGQTADGSTCSRCALPAGAYELQLITADNSITGPPARVAIRLDGGDPATTTLSADEGRAGLVRQHAKAPRTGPNNPLTPVTAYSGGFWENYGPPSGSSQRMLLVSHASLSLTAGAAPVAAAVLERCGRLGGPQECERKPATVGDQADFTGVDVFTGDGQQDYVSVVWDVVGDARWEVRNTSLWVALEGNGVTASSTASDLANYGQY